MKSGMFLNEASESLAAEVFAFRLAIFLERMAAGRFSAGMSVNKSWYFGGTTWPVRKMRPKVCMKTSMFKSGWAIIIVRRRWSLKFTDAWRLMPVLPDELRIMASILPLLKSSIVFALLLLELFIELITGCDPE